MNHRLTAGALAAVAVLALAGCASSNNTSDKPTGTPAATSAAPTTTPLADQIAACTDAIAGGSDSSAPECADLSADDYMKALQAANQQGRDALQSQLDAATSQP